MFGAGLTVSSEGDPFEEQVLLCSDQAWRDSSLLVRIL